MGFEHKDNAGSLFANGYKTEPKHPDHQGSCKIVCPSCGHKQEFKISAWINELKDNAGKYFGLAFGLPQVKETPVNRGPEDFDDDIPF
jgi:hypothetical protein